MKKIKIKIKGKIIEAEVCDSVFSRARGLMFRKKPTALFFIFNNSKKRAIHSFFCKPFNAIWFNGNKIVDEKYVKSWKFYVCPKNDFDRLLEISVG
jgi:uncharacterized membrane protein (UPF0127 family)